VSTGEFAATEMLGPLPGVPGPVPPDGLPSGPGGSPAGNEPAAGPGTFHSGHPLDSVPWEREPAPGPVPDPGQPAAWDDIRAQADENLAAVRARAGIAMDGIARDHQAALDHVDELPEIPQDRRPGGEGLPFDVAPGSFLAAACCPSCSYGLGGRGAVHVLAGSGAQRTAVVVHQECAGEAL
jgi:hypothetical protein